MPTNKPRIHVSFEEDTVEILLHVAEHREQSVASLVRNLALEALELDEDYYLSKIAEKRDQKNVKTYTHKDAWKAHTKSSTKKP